MNETSSKPRGVFVTATDTGMGKTWVSIGLIKALRTRNFRVAGMKPVATGCEGPASMLRNSDALQLHEVSSLQAPYDLINPYRFKPPIAPHLAAARIGCSISLEEIQKAYTKLTGMAEFVVVEGLGGWLVPLGGRHDVSDMVRALGIPVLLVIGLRLGCINHALLSARAIREDGAQLLGWIATGVDPDYSTTAETCDYLGEALGAPPLAVVPNLAGPAPEQLAGYMGEVVQRLQKCCLGQD